MPMETIARHAFTLFNVCEGVFWIGFAAGFAVAYRTRSANADLIVTAALLFVAFGVSDFVEIQTGGWYKPWWLLAWKATNLAGLAAIYVLYRRRKATSTADAP